MDKFLKLYFVALPLFLVIDLVWLVFVARNFYARSIGFLMAPSITWWAAVLFYLLFIAGLVVFVIHPAVREDSCMKAFFLGGFFGLVTYATYDLTNLATLNNWPLLVTVVDLAWGTLLGGSVSGITYLISKKIL